MQGRSLRPIVHGNTPADWRDDFFYDYIFEMYPGDIPRSIGVRTDFWKYVRYTARRPQYEQLFDLRNDPHETNNLAQDPAYASVLQDMRERLESYRERLPDRVPDYHEYADQFDVIGIGDVFPQAEIDFAEVGTIGQSFRAETDKLAAIEWRWPFFVREYPPFPIEVTLRRGGPGGEILATDTLQPEEIYNLNLARAHFRQSGLTPGEKLYVSIEPRGDPRRRAVGMWRYTTEAYPFGRAFLDGEPVPGDIPLYFIFAR